MKKAFILSILLLGACQHQTTETSSWVGRWTGPEGTFMEITHRDAVPTSYDVAIRDLDHTYLYRGYAKGDTIVFNRRGVFETIRPGNGEETGMKWLADKKNCLVVKLGEGYCRG